ncbi:LysR family transcriptional regulator, partial [mine drainage metagenome]
MRHQCIVRTAAQDGDAWPFAVGGKAALINVAGCFRASSAAAANEAAVPGLGIGNAPFWQVRTVFDQDRIELVLTDFEPPPIPLHALSAAMRIVPAKTKLFVDLL